MTRWLEGNRGSNRDREDVNSSWEMSNKSIWIRLSGNTSNKSGSKQKTLYFVNLTVFWDLNRLVRHPVPRKYWYHSISHVPEHSYLLIFTATRISDLTLYLIHHWT
jgi:hypothetical protein